MNFKTFNSVWIAVAFLLVIPSVGCNSSGESLDRYAEHSDSDADFAAGAKRAPTPRTLHQMAKVISGQGRDDEAQFVLERLLRAYPDYSPAYISLAELHMRHDRPEDAMQMLDEALRINPNDAVAINNLGMCHFLGRRYDAALMQFDKASELNPKNARYTANRALVHGMLGQYEQSFGLYKSVMPIAQAHFNLFVIAEARNDYERAKAEYDHAILNGFDPEKGG